jgi:hypothetical protein
MFPVALLWMLLAAGDVETGDAEGGGMPFHLPEAGLLHHLQEGLRLREMEDGVGEVAVSRGIPRKEARDGGEKVVQEVVSPGVVAKISLTMPTCSPRPVPVTCG